MCINSIERPGLLLVATAKNVTGRLRLEQACGGRRCSRFKLLVQYNCLWWVCFLEEVYAAPLLLVLREQLPIGPTTTSQLTCSGCQCRFPQNASFARILDRTLTVIATVPPAAASRAMPCPASAPSTATPWNGTGVVVLGVWYRGPPVRSVLFTTCASRYSTDRWSRSKRKATSWFGLCTASCPDSVTGPPDGMPAAVSAVTWNRGRCGRTAR
jgi:hypothetical protein